MTCFCVLLHVTCIKQHEREHLVRCLWFKDLHFPLNLSFSCSRCPKWSGKDTGKGSGKGDIFSVILQLLAVPCDTPGCTTMSACEPSIIQLQGCNTSGKTHLMLPANSCGLEAEEWRLLQECPRWFWKGWKKITLQKHRVQPLVYRWSTFKFPFQVLNHIPPVCLNCCSQKQSSNRVF